MSEIDGPVIRKRYPWVAVMLSLVLAGLGQVYCGALARGLLLTCLGALCIPLSAALIANQAPVGSFTLAIVAIVGLLGFTIVSAVDAYRLARRSPSGYVLKEYNRMVVYSMIFLTGRAGDFGAVLFTRDRLCEAFVVQASSMAPTIERGDRVLGNKIAYASTDPQRGDVVVFLNPSDFRMRYVKRIVAVGGDTIEMKDGRVILNGRELPRETLPDAQQLVEGERGAAYIEHNGSDCYVILEDAAADRAPRDLTALTIPPHHCFVLGDNRTESLDSRTFGAIPLTSILARVDYLYWPAEGWSRFGQLGPRTCAPASVTAGVPCRRSPLRWGGTLSSRALAQVVVPKLSSPSLLRPTAPHAVQLRFSASTPCRHAQEGVDGCCGASALIDSVNNQ